MNFNQLFSCIRIFALSLIGAVATQAQQPQSSEPDAPATAARPSVPSQQLTSAVPHEIKFAGVLKDSSGKPLAGIVSVTFALYDQQEGGTASVVRNAKRRTGRSGPLCCPARFRKQLRHAA